MINQLPFACTAIEMMCRYVNREKKNYLRQAALWKMTAAKV
jgi:hypothetical protein